MGELNPNSRFKKQGMDSAFFMGEKISKGFCKPNKYDDYSGIFKLLIE